MNIKEILLISRRILILYPSLQNFVNFVSTGD